MSKKFLMLGALALVVPFVGQQAASAESIVITPGQATDKTVTYQSAAPTRHFDVEKATTLAPGESRFGANLQVGGLGIGGTTPGIAGGVNVRADMNVQPGLEAGISATGLGGAGSANLLGDLSLRGKLSWTEFSIGATPVEVGALANIGGFLTGGGLTSGSIGVGIPMTAALMNNLNVTVSPGVGFGFAAGGLLPGGTPAQVGAAGFLPAVGLGLDLGLTDRLSALVDANLGWASGFGATGNAGLRYGITDDLAADLFVGYKGNPLTGGLNTGTVGLGGYYAF
jgi:hypothetical protein